MTIAFPVAFDMPSLRSSPITRKAFRRTDDYTPGTSKVQLVTEDLPSPLTPNAVLIKVHAVSLNYRDANIANGGNPWPVIPHGILCNDAAGEVVAVGQRVTKFQVGDRVAPIIDTKNLTGREAGRSWLAADEDGVLADFIVFDEEVVVRLPEYLDWTEASIIPCAGTTAWAALQGFGIGSSVLIQGTGGVSMVALKLARAAGMKVILTSSSDEKLKTIAARYKEPELMTVNYKTNENWHEEVLRFTNGVGVDLVIEIGGATSIVPSLKCTRRGGTISSVGYLSGKKDIPNEMLSLLIDRRVNLRGINAGSRIDMEELVAALEATRIRFDDIIDDVRQFEEAEQAIRYLWEGKVVGKLVLSIHHE
ncbi:Zinc-type alcohol dehydrogenase-like protein [Cercospora beticola]|uniref:Zinc-type alcohol dehydrogenase-like protein n=2 Tax=Cercospora beticola TaxID=122368 RepID=A0A2G5HKQ4_CERBT|nr:Zinc-type alcohol dehydrogenase-like protein [Cercospora beticola]PIA93146.1 Zinc-type alcohol dehydrogenase-like protein [Cercospora beticola]